MPAEIRQARASDVDALVALKNAVFAADRISRSAFRRLAKSSTAAMFVAGRRNAIDGYCVVLFRARSRIARLYSIAAASESGGIGRALLDAAENAAVGRGCKALRLEVREDNFRAIDLYEKSGYRRFARKPGYYADGAAALRYEKTLLPAVAGQQRSGDAVMGAVTR